MRQSTVQKVARKLEVLRDCDIGWETIGLQRGLRKFGQIQKDQE